ncbi:MAG: ABC transporter permease [Anaerolineae bacterium]
MTGFAAAFWAETLKARRAKITLLIAAGVLLLPLASGFFMLILKNPEQARSLGLIGAKAQITAGVADWPSYFGMLTQGMAVAGAILFALMTAWVFGREFSDHTAKELLALPTPRWNIVIAKFVWLGLWVLALTLLVFVVGLGFAAAITIPGWSLELARTALGNVLVTAILTALLMPFVAFFASLGRGYLLPMGWTILALAFANILSVLGWGDWFPWAVPVLASGMVRSDAGPLGAHSYLVVLGAALVGVIATVAWWQSADQTR